MKVILAGFNLDSETIRALEAKSGVEEPLTPETLSAAYARISRNPLPVNELRAVARRDVDKARKSNRAIVFEMGHSSVAEHAVFNIDVIGISRLVVEEIEKFRLCSFTEKSQRYIRLEDDFVIPEEIRDSGLAEPFIEAIARQNALYHELYQALRAHVFERHRELAAESANHSMLEGWAKEDARYVVSLATETQLGMTLNARNLELMLRRAAAHPLKEVNSFGTSLYAATHHIAPSLVRYTSATPFDRMTRAEMRGEVNRFLRDVVPVIPSVTSLAGDDRVRLVDSTPGGDERIIASLIHSSSMLPFEKCVAAAGRLSPGAKQSLIKTALAHMESYDLPPREFERASLTYELVTSASCFAQLKRHRMATIIAQAYDPALGVTVPPAVRETGMEDRFMNLMKETDTIHDRIYERVPHAASYVLTNAHRRRVLIEVNARELYHIARLRGDASAQWDIRETAERMVALGKTVMPLALMLACGKDGFRRLRTDVFGEPQ